MDELASTGLRALHTEVYPVFINRSSLPSLCSHADKIAWQTMLRTAVFARDVDAIAEVAEKAAAASPDHLRLRLDPAVMEAARRASTETLAERKWLRKAVLGPSSSAAVAGGDDDDDDDEHATDRRGDQSAGEGGGDEDDEDDADPDFLAFEAILAAATRAADTTGAVDGQVL